MERGIYHNNFSKVFSQLLKMAGVSCYQISQYTGLTQAYLSRLKTGEKQNPSPQTILMISLALAHFSDKIRIQQIRKLFESVMPLDFNLEG